MDRQNEHQERILHPLRQAAEARLKHIKGAFLRCDRGNALYVSNVLVRTDEAIDWNACDFEARIQGKMTYLIPKFAWIAIFEDWIRNQCSEIFLTHSIENAMFSLEAEDIELWIKGMKCLEMQGNSTEYEKAVRQRAAVCLRQKRGGNTLRACALIVDILRK